jgi:sirohydrochlorin cobaltochelatase
MKEAVILLAHGSPDPTWREPIARLREKLEARGKLVGDAYLRDIEPDIFIAAKRLLEHGADKILVIPVFLAAGTHSAKDFPELASGLEERHPDICFEWTDVLGAWDEVLDAMANAILAGGPGKINR